MKRHPFNCNGVTLVLTLCVIVLITVLIVALLSQAQSSRQGSHMHVEALRAAKLGESAVNMVVSTIQTATRTPYGTAWASQPGAIQVYDATGKLSLIYKLYSAENAQAGQLSDLDSDSPPADWAQQTNLFTDLNAPVSRDGKLIFPVVDPRLYSGNASVDPDGFSYTSSVAGTVLPSGSSSDAQRLPMPVRWMYVTSDGDFVVPEPAQNVAVNFPSLKSGAEIVGRVAFWTDDESCKVNVNTAAGGESWDTPRIYSTSDVALAEKQPVQGEFQRYPGHPATVDLREVFPALSLDQIYGLVPRIQPGGSNQGQVVTVYAGNTVPAITPDKDRLFPSIGELEYKPDRTAYASIAGFGTAYSDRIGRAGFLISSWSRAPELNLFGRPRVAMWPLSTGTGSGDRSSLDRLIALCSTINESGATAREYYFQRKDASSPTNDYVNIARNQQLLAFLQKETSEQIPGVGGDFSDKYGTHVRDQILTEVFDYIRSTINLRNSSATPYADPAPYDPNNSASILEKGEGQVAPINISSWGTKGFGRFLSVAEPFFWFTWQGTGVNTSLSGTAANADPAVAPAYPLPADSPSPDKIQVQAVFCLQFSGQAVGYCQYGPDITVKVENLDQLTLNGTNMGFPATATLTLDVMNEFPLGGLVDFRSFVRNKRFTRDETAADRFPFYSNIMEVPRTQTATPVNQTMAMAGSSNPIIVTIYAGPNADAAHMIQQIQLQIPAAKMPVPLKPADISAAGSGSGASRFWGTGNSGVPDRFYQGSSKKACWYMDLNNDVIRSMVSLTGDHRLTAGLRSVPSSFFIAHQGANGTTPNAWTSNTKYVESLYENQAVHNYGPVSTGAIGLGKFDIAAVYGGGVPKPQLPTHIKGKPAGAKAWDWDTGIGEDADGAFINKPDEGSAGRITNDTKIPYFGAEETWDPALGDARFFPNRQVVSAGMLGSLPTGIDPNTPASSTAWQTLLLRPDPAGHPGNASPKDHLLLDLFWMPVVEPYAISEPFSTAGKVNLNCQLVPFKHINRDTALRAALRDEKILAIAASDAGTYKDSPAIDHPRMSLDLNETMKGIQQHLAAGKLFRSPTEICEVYLVPQGQTYAGMETFWQNNTLTGDNVREKPYANMLAKLTTKSNTYTVHVIAQALKKVKGAATNPVAFGIGGDSVTAEWRGSFVIERFLDPNDSRLPDFAGSDAIMNWTDAKYNGDNYYQNRTIQVRECR